MRKILIFSFILFCIGFFFACNSEKALTAEVDADSVTTIPNDTLKKLLSI